jgi:hypothetical protein
MARRITSGITSGVTDAEVHARFDQIIGLLDNPTPQLQAAIEDYNRPTPAKDYESIFARALAGHEDLMERARQ